jgi:hypothetical protein
MVRKNWIGIVFLALAGVVISAGISRAEPYASKPVVSGKDSYGRNLIENPGFEDGFKNWVKDYGDAVIDKEAFHGGRASLKITRNGCVSTKLIPNTGAAIKLSLWIKTGDIKTGKNQWNMGQVMVTEYNKDRKSLGQSGVFSLSGTRTWEKYEQELSFDKQVKYIRFNLMAYAMKAGDIWFDDLRVEFFDPSAIPEGFQ